MLLIHKFNVPRDQTAWSEAGLPVLWNGIYVIDIKIDTKIFHSSLLIFLSGIY